MGHGTERRAKTVSEAQLQNFSARARAALGADFEANVAIFFWLAKAAYGGNVDEDLLLRYTRYVRRQGLAGSEEQLVKVLRSLIGVSRTRETFPPPLRGETSRIFLAAF
ncbi:unnamed protein product [Effrenium voratum]|uniref:Uncharacterized protein n=1 Tax=Effrenium voratum TaxID=2562239 RepID=A0AA36J9F4_9DINO|nr:unnamed protein product [Effrenium voratum]